MKKKYFYPGIFLLSFLLIGIKPAFTQVVTEEWVARYNGPANGSDVANDIALDSLGNVYVTGRSDGSGTRNDYATIKYDSVGNELWVRRYNGPANSYDVANDIALDSSGNVYVTGESSGSGTGGDYATIKYDSAGNELWLARYNGPGNYSDQATGIALDSSGNVYVTGRSDGSGTLSDYATIKYNSAGNELWVARYNGPANSYDDARGIALDSLGNVYVTGNSRESGTRNDYATIKYDSAGNELWVARYNGPKNWDWVEAIAVDSSGNVYVTGISVGSGASPEYATIKYDSAGSELWVARYNGPANGGDEAYDIALDFSGNVYVTGRSVGSGTRNDYATIKYDSDGNELWVARYNGPGNYIDCAYGIALDSSGNVYVTGESHGSGTVGDYATIKYDSDGNELWVARYNGPGNSYDYATGIALDSSGNVYVTGNSRESGTRNDYATIKYSQPFIVYPNPYKPPEGHTQITFSGLSEDVRVRIFSISGELIIDRQIAGQSSWVWDGKNERGEAVARGIYIYLITNSEGGKKIGKIAIIR